MAPDCSVTLWHVLTDWETLKYSQLNSSFFPCRPSGISVFVFLFNMSPFSLEGSLWIQGECEKLVETSKWNPTPRWRGLVEGLQPPVKYSCCYGTEHEPYLEMSFHWLNTGNTYTRQQAPPSGIFIRERLPLWGRQWLDNNCSSQSPNTVCWWVWWISFFNGFRGMFWRWKSPYLPPRWEEIMSWWCHTVFFWNDTKPQPSPQGRG